jgi:hypothetical protein
MAGLAGVSIPIVDGGDQQVTDMDTGMVSTVVIVMAIAMAITEVQHVVMLPVTEQDPQIQTSTVAGPVV